MSEQSTTESRVPQTVESRRRKPLLAVGSVLWVLCFAGIVFFWMQQRQRFLAVQDESKPGASKDDDDGDGRNGKSIKLFPQKDGSIVAKEVGPGDHDLPWDKDGIEDFAFVDTNGKKVTKQDFLGKPFVISFVFTNCRGPCPKVTLQMKELQNALKDYDFNLISLTVDPDRDTTEALQLYGKNYGADFDRWKFLTGEQSDIYGLIHRSFNVPVEEATGANRKPGFEIIHSTNIMLVDATGRVVGKFDGRIDDEIVRLSKELKRMAKRKTNVIEAGDEAGK